MNAAEIAAARLLLEARSDDPPFGLRLLARIEAAWRARQAEVERERRGDAVMVPDWLAGGKR